MPWYGSKTELVHSAISLASLQKENTRYSGSALSLQHPDDDGFYDKQRGIRLRFRRLFTSMPLSDVAFVPLCCYVRDWAHRGHGLGSRIAGQAGLRQGAELIGDDHCQAINLQNPRCPLIASNFKP